MVIATSLHRFLFSTEKHQRTLFLVPSVEIGKSSIGGKWRSLSAGLERTNLRAEDRSPERLQLKNNFEVNARKPYTFISVRRTPTSDVLHFQGEMRHDTRSHGVRRIQFNLRPRNRSEVHSVLSHESVAFSFARRRNCEENAFDPVPNVGFATWFVRFYDRARTTPLWRTREQRNLIFIRVCVNVCTQSTMYIKKRERKSYFFDLNIKCI